MKVFDIKLSGHSMWPTIKDGQKVYYSDSTTSLEIGDIILFKDTNNELVTHRIISNNITKGDRCYFNDDKFTESQIIAKAIGTDLYFWGEKGQRFKYYISFLSRKMRKDHPLRYFYFLGLIIISRIDFLFSVKTKINHNEEIQKKNP